MKESGSEPRVVLGAAIRRQRLKRGVTQETLGARADLHRTYIADIERGARNPSLETIVRIARALGVRPAALLKAIR